MWFDTHVHLWRPGDGHGVRIRARIPALDGDFGAERFAAVSAGVADRVVLVSAAQEEAETAALVAAAAADPGRVAAVIGWLDLTAPDFPDRLAFWRRHAGWRGVRLPLVLMDAEATWRHPRLPAALAGLADAGLVLELLLRPDQIATGAAALADHPTLRVVVDHAANPDVAAPPDPLWRDGIARLAALPGAVVKLSQFWAPGEAGPDDGRALPYVAAALDRFGLDRVVAAANWPVSALAEPYAAVFARLERLAGRAGLAPGAFRAATRRTARALFAPAPSRE